MKLKRLISILIILCFAILLSVGAYMMPETKPVEAELPEDYLFHVSICGDERIPDSDELIAGFRAALEEKIGEEHLRYSQMDVSDNNNAIAVAGYAVARQPDLIFTVGKKVLTSVSTITEDIPIVASGVMDYRSVLKLSSQDDLSKDRSTGRNVTGVTSRPAIVEQLSLLIEATPDLRKVALIYNPEDTDSIYQNEIMEKYLTQAGIPWKEFVLEVETEAEGNDTESDPVIILPVKKNTPSAKEGIAGTGISFGSYSIVGINNPSSARTARKSDNWVNKSHDMVWENPIDEIVFEASAIYIPSGSQLSGYVAEISKKAAENGVTTVGGDVALGENTLVSMGYDSYKLGYSAGEKAAKLLLDDDADITSMKFASVSGDDCIKFYNKEVAEVMGVTFPKSFNEINVTE